MAYAYPSVSINDEAGRSSLSLHSPSRTPGDFGHHDYPHGQTHGHGRTHSHSISMSHGVGPKRGGGVEDLGILKVFKRKLVEDEHYIDFFQERIKIEETYMESLRRLHSRSTAIDALHDNNDFRNPRSSTRIAWDEVRDYTDLEIQSRGGLVEALKAVVVPELVALKEEQTRIRHLLKDNIKTANEMYEEQAHNKVPKLKKAYFQKCQAVEDHKRQEAAVAAQARLLATPSPTSPATTPLLEHPNALSLSGSMMSQHSYGTSPFAGTSALSPPTSTGPLPPTSNPAMLDVQTTSAFVPPSRSSAATPAHGERSASISFGPGGTPGVNGGGGVGGGGSGWPGSVLGRSRAGSASASTGAAGAGVGAGADKKDPMEMLNDLAQQSKKGFHAIRQKLGGDKDKDKEKEKDREHKDDGAVPAPSALGVTGISGGLGGSQGIDRQSEDTLGGVGSDTRPGTATGGGLQRRGTFSKDRNASLGLPATGFKAGEPGAVKAARIKREQEEAEKAYRDGVFLLETLRLRREKVYLSAMNNLETLNDELNKAVKRAFQQYVDAIHGTAATNAQSTEIANEAISAINLDKDMMLFRTYCKGLNRAPAAPVLYENFYVGPCRSLIFGVGLGLYDFARGEGSDHGRPPTIVEKCINAIDDRGLEIEGIYRISGRKAAVQLMIQDIEKDEEQFEFSEREDVHSISNVLKQYLRELPEPVFPLPHAERVRLSTDRDSLLASGFAPLRVRLRRLPPIHQTTFRAVLEHLRRVQARSTVNKMDAKNLAVVFNAVLFGQDQAATDTDVLAMALAKDTVLEDLILHADLLFAPGEVSPTTSSSTGGLARRGPALPGDRAEEAAGARAGSSRTKFSVMDTPAPIFGVPTGTAALSPRARQATLLDDLAREPDVIAPTGLAAGSAAATMLAAPESVSQPSAEFEMFTPDDELDLMFEPGLIPDSMKDGLGEEYHVRPLANTDLMRSHFGLLSTLTAAPAMPPSQYKSLFTYMKANCSGTYFTVVIVSRRTDQLVAAGTLLLERKYIHGGGLAGHIEDIVVSPDMRGRGMGLRLVEGLRRMAELLGCYKTVLTCKEDKVPFYEKCGFKLRSMTMAYYVPTSPDGAAPAQSSTNVVQQPALAPPAPSERSVHSPSAAGRVPPPLPARPPISAGQAARPVVPSVIDLTQSEASHRGTSSASGSDTDDDGSVVTYTVAGNLDPASPQARSRQPSGTAPAAHWTAGGASTSTALDAARSRTSSVTGPNTSVTHPQGGPATAESTTTSPVNMSRTASQEPTGPILPPGAAPPLLSTPTEPGASTQPVTPKV